MIKLVVSNQKGSIGKTTTAIALARCMADRGLRRRFSSIVTRRAQLR